VRRGSLVALATVLAALVSGCRQDMHDQPRFKPLARSTFFDDEQSARPLVEGTVPRDGLRPDDLLHTGKLGTEFADTFPLPVTIEVLQRGRQQYDVFCSPCHGRIGDGQGMVARRGFKIRPASFHDERVRALPVGHYFDVITRGFGVMQDYSAQIGVEDRWAVVAYLRVLQRSQAAALSDVPPAEREKLAADTTAAQGARR
jgi:hypothetical protein